MFQIYIFCKDEKKNTDIKRERTRKQTFMAKTHYLKNLMSFNLKLCELTISK